MTLSINRLNPNCTTFTVGNRTWYWSYQICMAFEQFHPERPATQRFDRVRRHDKYSVTTEKHMAYMGVSDWPRVDDATFEKMAGGES